MTRSAALIVAIAIMAATSASAKTIGNDPGGILIEYVLRVAKLKRTGERVAFVGRCSSACTLYLSLPATQVCVSRSASFGFHLPRGSSRAASRLAAGYIMRSYPAWVRSYINRRGGLTSQTMHMPSSYARKFIATCRSGGRGTGR